MKNLNSTSSWLDLINNKIQKKNGKQPLLSEGRKLSLEWEFSTIASRELTAFKRKVADFTAKQLAPLESAFLKKFPEAAASELFLKECMPFIKEGAEKADFEAIEQKIASSIKRFYEIDIREFGEEVIKPLLSDLYCTMTLTDEKTGALEGVLIASITPALAFGNVKLILLTTLKPFLYPPLLIDALVKIIPGIRRLFIFARPTSAVEIKALYAMGFKPCEKAPDDPHHKVNMEYLKQFELFMGES